MSMRPALPDVTLVAATSVAVAPTIRALQASMRELQFGKVLLFSDKAPPPEIDPAIEWRQVAPMLSREDYSRFMLRSLADHVATTHALCVQWDGFVLSGRAWDPTFLHYDYIGPVWPHFLDGYNVGNGGFSLRSKRLLESCRDLPFDGTVSEDILICRISRRCLEKLGIRFAPEVVARRFAYERSPPNGSELGFHGAFNLVRYMAPSDTLALFRSLEPAVLSRSEHIELLRWAVAGGYGRLAFAILRRLRRLRSGLTGR